MLQDAMLKFVFEYLPVGSGSMTHYLPVAVNDELALDEVEHDTAPRPFLVLGFIHDVGQAVWRAACPPALP